MKLSMSQQGLLFVLLAVSLPVVFLPEAVSEVLSGDQNALRGPAFTDISQVMEMPDRWKRQAIKYDTSAGDADIVISLDQQMYPALMPLIETYARNNKLKIEIKSGTCGVSSGMLSRKSVNIAGLCCPPGKGDRLPGLRFHTLGVSALAIIVHPDNLIDNVTLGQARQIFMGEISRWSELKKADGKRGPNLPIQPVGRLHCKLRPGHWRLLLDNEDLFSSGILEVGAIPDMIAKVSADSRAIGYETMWMTRYFYQKGSVKALKINGYDPDIASNLLSGKYPLYRVYNLTTWEGKGLANPAAMKLVNFLLNEVKNLDAKFGLIPSSSLRQTGWKFSGNELIGALE